MIPDCFKGTVGCTADESVGAVLVSIVPLIELLLCHIYGIKACTWKQVVITVYKRFAVKTVPRTVVNLSISFLYRI